MKDKSKIKEIGEKIRELRKFADENNISLIAIARDDESGESPQAVVGRTTDLLAMLYGVFIGIAENDVEKAKMLMHFMLVMVDSNAVTISEAKK